MQQPFGQFLNMRASAQKLKSEARIVMSAVEGLHAVFAEILSAAARCA